MYRAALVVTLGLGAVGMALCAPVAYTSNIQVHSDSAGTQVWVADDTTLSAVNVSDGLQAALNPAWAPDGSRLAFQAVETAYPDIFVCAPDGSGRQNLTAGATTPHTMPAFVGDANSIVCLAGPDRSHVVLLRPDSEPVQLTAAALYYTQPVALPDGSGVLVTGLEAVRGAGDIYQVSLDGRVRNLTQAPGLYSQPAVSPDGSTVAFCFDRREIGGVGRGVATIPIDGGEPTLLADDGYPLGALAYSPDGRRIAYTFAPYYNNTWIRIMDADGSNAGRLEFGGYHIIAWPSFSPDGARLAYHGCYAARFTTHVVDLVTGQDTDVSEKSGGGVRPVYCPAVPGGVDQ